MSTLQKSCPVMRTGTCILELHLVQLSGALAGSGRGYSSKSSSMCVPCTRANMTATYEWRRGGPNGQTVAITAARCRFHDLRRLSPYESNLLILPLVQIGGLNSVWRVVAGGLGNAFKALFRLAVGFNRGHGLKFVPRGSARSLPAEWKPAWDAKI
jgi:hypothetical protein